ncbi:DNA-3-methyladenine glycosylase 2 family protein [Paludisphaera mucosa]|uniref:DNA-3-methyladenine glycosylase II n=1 Tax=Paludisphaera mucosa TaxID=3030827 RepID=A0ABT6FBQ0_9BACT|nr:AlkA N-terminal domain-containing protein [Paludisphaera mucosa]MDG3004931.1 AlkA N-terminal domain-containing protein [Paludisphaera mucosa]
MEIEPDLCYRALTARDPRFDGLFFVGVTSTHIYCRPICPARTPGRDRCRFFPGAAAAERAGYRPCLRCRPELAPGDAPVDAVGRTARLAAKRIGAGAMDDEGGLEALAGEMGIGSRHLRRVLRQELGVSPVELAQTHRLLLAKQLLTDTGLPIIDVAFASGFASVRRFNALFRARYRLTPRDFRRSGGAKSCDGRIRLTLAYRPPLDWAALLRFLSGRAAAGVEAVVGASYYRTVDLGEVRSWIKVEPAAGRHALVVDLPMGSARGLPALLGRLRNLFDLDARPDAIAEHLGRDDDLGEEVRSNPGLRVPGAFDGFELAVRAVLGQQVSVRGATTLAGRLAAAFGEPVETPVPQLSRLSPSPARVADARLDELTGLGLVAARAECVRALARAVCDRAVSLDAGPDPAAGLERLTAIPGVGPWTAHYIAMRGWRWPDAFPHTDLGLRKALGGRPAGEVLAMAEAWRPWRAYAAMHLWNRPTDGR